MTDEMHQSLIALRNDLADKKQQMQNLAQGLGALSIEIDDYRLKKLANGIAKLALSLDNLYAQIDLLWIVVFAGKDQIELLKGIIMSIPEVKNNPEVMEGIKQAHRTYKEKYGEG